MRHDPLFTLWSVQCRSSHDCDRLRQWLAEAVTLDSTFTDEARAFPDGVEVCRREQHRLGDYFQSVRVLPSSEPNSFRVLFQRHPTAGRFWKDLMVRILESVRREAGATTTLEYRGDVEPQEQPVGP